jgi:hypothetical protein
VKHLNTVSIHRITVETGIGNSFDGIQCREEFMKTRLIIATSFVTTVIVLVIMVGVLALANPTLAKSLPSGHLAAQQPSLAETHLALPQNGSGPYLSLPPSSFINLYSDIGYDFSEEGCMHHTTGSEGGYFSAAVSLPYGSRINTVRFFYYDLWATSDASLVVQEGDYIGGFLNLVSLASSGDPGFGSAEATGLDLALDYENKSYIILYDDNHIGAAMQLCGVRIGYTPPGIFGSALPVIQK